MVTLEQLQRSTSEIGEKDNRTSTSLAQIWTSQKKLLKETWKINAVCSLPCTGLLHALKKSENMEFAWISLGKENCKQKNI